MDIQVNGISCGGGEMRVPIAYTATEIVNWHIAEQYEPGKWRPSRCCGFDGIRHWKMRLRLAWSVWTGRNDVLVWGDKSGLNGYTQRDCTERGFINAAKVIDRLPENLGVKL